MGLSLHFELRRGDKGKAEKRPDQRLQAPAKAGFILSASFIRRAKETLDRLEITRVGITLVVKNIMRDKL